MQKPLDIFNYNFEWEQPSNKKTKAKLKMNVVKNIKKKVKRSAKVVLSANHNHLNLVLLHLLISKKNVVTVKKFNP